MIVNEFGISLACSIVNQIAVRTDKPTGSIALPDFIKELLFSLSEFCTLVDEFAMLTIQSNILLVILSVTTYISVIPAVLMTLALYLINDKDTLNMIVTVSDSSTYGIISLMPEAVKTL